MSHSFLSPPVDLVDGHANHAIGARSVVYCIHGCRSATVRAPPELAERRCRDGAFVGDDHPTFASCPSNHPRLLPASPSASPPVPAASHAPAPPQPAVNVSGSSAASSSAAAQDLDGEWSQSMLRQIPTPFTDDDLIQALRRVRKPDAIEARLDESRHSVTSNVGDSHTERTFTRNRWTIPRDIFDTIPRRLSGSAIRRLSQANCLLLSLISALSSPAADAVRANLDGLRVPVSDRFPGTELVGVTDDPNSFPTATRVLETITAICLEADGVLLETSHFPNALRAAEGDGAVFLHGNQADLAAVRQQPLLSRLYESRLDADEASEPPIRFRPISDTLRDSAHARLSVLFRTPTTWVPRKRLLRLHWRWFWHRYTVAADDVHKSQLTLQNQYTAWKDRRDQLDVLRHARAGVPLGGARPAAAAHRAPSIPSVNQQDPSAHSKPRKRQRRDGPATPSTNATVAPPHGTAAASASAVTDPRAATSPEPLCRAAVACGACGAAKDTRHAPDCAWVASARASGRPLR